MRVRAVVNMASPLQLDLPFSIRTVSSPALFGPCVFGIFRPVLLLPNGIKNRLSMNQLKAVLQHELAHVRRRDNLMTAIHAVVEILFWFWPPVYWIGKRLMNEREAACDEDVLQRGHEPDVYAEGILSVCTLYLLSPERFASCIGGSELKRRIECILSNSAQQKLSFCRKALLLSGGVLAVVAPIAIGTLGVIPSFGQSDQISSAAFEVASVKPNRSGGPTTRNIATGEIVFIDITLGEFIRMAYGLSYHQLSGPDWVVNTASSDRFDVVARASGPASKQEMMLMLRTLLVDRFHLAVHDETRKIPMYALVIAKNGPKFKEGDGGAKSTSRDAAGGFSFKNWTMYDLANSLSMMAIVGRPVLDRTGLAGSYSFTANLSDLPKEATGTDAKEAAVNSDAIFSNLERELGLKLEPGRDPVQLVVIDHADKLPVPN